MSDKQSWATSTRARATMRANRGSNTKPELALRSALHRRGLRFRVNVRPLKAVRRSADVLFPRQQLAVFVDGCFWHGCPEHYVAPKQNASFWADKLRTNTARDVQTTKLLEDAGWTVVRLWEHVPVDQAADVVEQARLLLLPHL